MNVPKFSSENFRVTVQNIVKRASFFYIVNIKYFRLRLIVFQEGLQLNGAVIDLPELQKHFQQQLTKGVLKVLEGSILAQLCNKLPHIQQKRKQVYLINHLAPKMIFKQQHIIYVKCEYITNQKFNVMKYMKFCRGTN